VLALLSLAADAPIEPPDYGASLLQTLVALAAVCALAYVAVRFGLGRLYRTASSGRRMRVVERLPLDGRRALLLVEVDERTYLVGSGEGAPPALLAELAGARGAEPPAERRSFREVLDADEP
jgi:flagellar biogenesis protein FliO